MKNVLKYWLPIAFSVTVLAGLVYGVAQQNYRQNANDPQIQVSEDIADILAQGEDPMGLEQSTKIDLAKTLSPFIAVFGDDKKLIVSTGQLNGQDPSIPEGTLEAAKSKQSRITWMPQKGQRFALVISHYGGDKPGYLVVGRSLREVEARVKSTTLIIGIAWLITILGSLILTILLFKLPESKAVSPEPNPTPAPSIDNAA